VLLLSLVSLVPAVYCHKHIFPAPVAQLSLVVGGGREKEEEGHMCVSEIVCVCVCIYVSQWTLVNIRKTVE